MRGRMRTRWFLSVAALAAACATSATLEDQHSTPTRVLIVGMDTLRRDHTGTHGHSGGVTPGLDEIAASSFVFDQAWAPAPRTRPSFRSAGTGRWPREGAGAPTLGTLLSQQGFSTAGFVANVQLSRELGFSEGFDTWTLDNMADANVQVDSALGWLAGHAEENSLLFVHFMDPHIFYTAPEPFLDQFTSPLDREGLPDHYNRKRIIEQQRLGLLSAAQKRWIQGRYMGEVAFMDREISRLVEAVDDLPGETWMVFHSDHGEEFWDHNGFEHNHTLNDELLRAVLWVRPPGGRASGPERLSTPVSLVDIVPTLLGLLDIDRGRWPTFDGVDLSPLIREAESADELKKRLSERPLQIGHMMYSREQWGVVQGSSKYILTTATGEVSWTESGAVKTGRSSELEGALTEAIGVPLLDGWRVHFGELTSTLTIHLDSPSGHSEVIDPEALVRRRANLAWGEVPARTRSEVATVTQSQDKRTITVVPGTKASGTVFVSASTASGLLSVSCGGEEASLKPGTPQAVCGTQITAWAGPYLKVDSVSEADTRPTTAEISALKELGYIE